jgi:hypothetical protein
MAVSYDEETIPERAMTLRAEPMAGTFALAVMTDQEFETRMAVLKKGRERIAQIQRGLMDKDVDFGTIPGTPKPTLLKPGAEKLCDFYRFAADFIPERYVGDGQTAPHLAYKTRCELHQGNLDGPIVAVGYGSANSWERRYRYRTGERACPECGAVGTLLRSKRGKPEWFCWAKKGGCGKTFDIKDPKVVEQQVGDIENPDPWDLDTTLLKMAEKRAHVDATLRATAASGLFTQDVEDLGPQAQEEPPQPEDEAPKSLRETVAAKKAELEKPEEPPLPPESPQEALAAPETAPGAPAATEEPEDTGMELHEFLQRANKKSINQEDIRAAVLKVGGAESRIAKMSKAQIAKVAAELGL